MAHDDDARDVSEHNVERLLARYRPVEPDPAFARRVQALALTTAREQAAARHTLRRRAWVRPLGAAAAAALLVTLGVAIGRMTSPAQVVVVDAPPLDAPDVEAAPAPQDVSPVDSAAVDEGAPPPEPTPEPEPERTPEPEPEPSAPVEPAAPTDAPAPAPLLAARPREAAPAPRALAAGEALETGEHERARVRLPDGSLLCVDAGTRVRVVTERRVALERGEVYVEVAPRPDDPFVLATPEREVTALGTAFVVRAGRPDPQVAVTHGRVRVGDAVVDAGWRLSLDDGARAPLGRATHALSWARDLIASAEGRLVPPSAHAGGALVTRGPDGQEAPLSLRAYAIDVHLEDGFARTAIDQTYFNHTWGRLEGTFLFPLPPDASISRLAMYVEGRRMEGGMVERERARTVFETIRWQRRDPALLEWLDGSTFRMRVFPLEPRQEKRIVLGYTQRLPVSYDRTTYRFPAGHSLETSGTWGFRARVVGGAGLRWSCRTHALDARAVGDDLVLTARRGESRLDRDLVLVLERPDAAPAARVEVAEHEGHRYLALRLRNDEALAERPRRRDWVLLVETSADRDPVLARVAYDLARGLLQAAEAGDTFALVAASTRPRLLTDGREPCTPERVAAALDRLERQPLLGALDLGAALALCREVTAGAERPVLVHVGSGIPVLGERREAALLEALPPGAQVVGVGVGKRWNRALHRAAAARTGGYLTSVHPDEPVRWRALEVRSALDAPRLLDLKVEAPGVSGPFLTDHDALAHGEEALAVTRLAPHERAPDALVVTGTLDGAPWRREVPVERVERGAMYLPRTWGRLELDRRVAAGEERAGIVALSKELHVLSPYTSLLVLETEAMHREFDVPFGRVEPWAPYALPERIPVLTEGAPAAGSWRTRERVLSSILLRRPADPSSLTPAQGGVTAWSALGGQAPTPERILLGSSMFGGRTDRIPSGGDAFWAGARLNAAADDRVERESLPRAPERARGPRGRFVPDMNGNVVERLEDGRVGQLFSRGTRRLEETDWFYRSVEMPEDEEGQPTFGDDDEPWVMGNDLGVLNTPLGELDLRFGGFLHPRARAGYGEPARPERILGFGRQLPPQGRRARRAPADSRSLASDLLAFAPGMNTTAADVLATLEAECLDARPIPGALDPAARDLIEAARRAPWTRAVVFDDAGAEVARVSFEGGGAFVLERTVTAGVRERVVGDGTTLWHLYPELGVGARRAWSRFHLEAVLRPVVPWLLPAAWDLARGADVRLLREGLVEVRPLRRGADRLHLVFEGQRLAERRWVDARGQVVARERYAAGGAVDVEGPDGRASWRLDLTPRAAPARGELVPGSDLVLLPLPFRGWPMVRPRVVPDSLADPDGPRQVAAGLCEPDHAWGAQDVLQRSVEAGDRRTGVAVLGLLFRQVTWLGQRDGAPDTDLERYVAEQGAFLRGGAIPAAWAPERDGTLFGRLALFRHLAARWTQGACDVGQVTRDGSLALLERLARDPRGRALAWALAQRITWTDQDDPAGLTAIARVVEAIASAPDVAEPAGLLAARLRVAAGEVEVGRERLLALHAAALRDGRLLPVDAWLRRALGEGFAGWASDAARALVERGSRLEALELARACRELKEPALARGLVDVVVAEPSTLEGEVVRDAAALLVWLDARDRALALVDAWAVTPRATAEVITWAVSLAHERPLLALRWQERAVELAYGAPGGAVRVDVLNATFGELFARYEAVVDAARTLEQPPPPDLVGRVTRAADRWRALAPEPGGACERAARLLSSLGEDDLAWEYLASLVALQPAEAARWATLAQALAKTDAPELADACWARAFELEPTNAEYLWRRAELLRSHGREDLARPLLERLANESWQPRFQSYRSFALEALSADE